MSVRRVSLSRHLWLSGILSLGLCACGNPESDAAGTGVNSSVGGSSDKSSSGGSSTTSSSSTSKGGNTATSSTTAAGGTTASGGSDASGGSKAEGSSPTSSSKPVGAGGSTKNNPPSAGGAPAAGGSVAKGGSTVVMPPAAGRQNLPSGGTANGGSESGGSDPGSSGRGPIMSPGGRAGGGRMGGGGTPVTPTAGGSPAPAAGSSSVTPVGTCTKGPTKGSDVAMIGESFIAMSHGITKTIESKAQAAGSLASGDKYKDNSVSGTLLSGNDSNAIPKQYDKAVPVKFVLMDGGGNDCLQKNDGDAALAAAKTLFQKMATDGVQKVQYFFYPDPIGSSFSSLKSCLDTLRPKMQALCEGLTAPKCYWLDLRTVWNGHNEYTSDGIHPTDAGSKATGEAIWAEMVKNCIAQ